VGCLFDGGRYLIKKHLGEGYCSHVYLAEDYFSSSSNKQEGAKQLVALKVFKQGDEFSSMAQGEFQLIQKL
jgi:hypothetical protein